MDIQKLHSRARLKDKLSNLLVGGAGSLVVATAVMIAAPAEASPRPPAAQVVQSAESVRAKFLTEASRGEQQNDQAVQLAWWGWGNGGWWHPRWHNWPNWPNWPNWGNW